MNQPSSQRILGIWRLGRSIADGVGTQLFLAQPADAIDSPRWDYVVKTVSSGSPGTPTPLQATRKITQTIAVASVTHPNLMPVLDASASGTSPFVVMPRLHAIQLSERIAQIPRFALPVALWWTRQLAQAVEALHQRGWIHGDILPANVLVDSQGHATLTDPGFATQIHSPLPALFRGTAGYAAPELVNGKTAALAAMDIFSLGRILWECLAETEPTAPGRVEKVADLIESMLAPEPTQRPSASDVVRELLNLEIETLGCHIVPERSSRRRAA